MLRVVVPRTQGKGLADALIASPPADLSLPVLLSFLSHVLPTSLLIENDTPHQLGSTPHLLPKLKHRP